MRCGASLQIYVRKKLSKRKEHYRMCELKTKNTLNLADAIDSSSKSRFFRLQAKELDQLSLYLKEELLNSHSRPLENSFNQTVPRPDKRLFKLIQ